MGRTSSRCRCWSGAAPEKTLAHPPCLRPAVDTFVTNALLDLPTCFLACDDPDAHFVSCPLLGAASNGDSAEEGPYEGLSW